jgi:hypothetical protein
MSDQMASLYQIDIEDGVNDGAPYAALPTRTQCLRGLKERNVFDLLILGGGLTGATVAHEAALQGISSLLLEPSFFGLDALSWDVRLAYCLRVHPSEIFRSRGALKMLGEVRAPHLISGMPADSHKDSGLLAKLARRFTRLQSVDEALLVRETILAARQEGAVALSSVHPEYVEAESASGCYVVGFADRVTGEKYEARVGGIVIDPTHGELPSSRLGSYVVPSCKPGTAGIQVVYSAFPQKLTAGVVFASFELTDGSVVTVCKRGLQVVEATLLYGKKPVPAENHESIIREACSEAGWGIDRELSRREIAAQPSGRYALTQYKGVFTCSHRAQWDAFRSARRIVQAVVTLSPNPRTISQLSARLLPGGDYACELDSFRAMARAQGVSERTIELAISRWRGRVRYIAEFPNGLRELCPGLLRGEVDLSIVSDQAVCADDVISGSLRVDTLPEWPETQKIIEERVAVIRESLDTVEKSV